MLDEMDAGQFAEWLAFEQIQEDAHKRAELAARAEAELRNRKRGRR